MTLPKKNRVRFSYTPSCDRSQTWSVVCDGTPAHDGLELLVEIVSASHKGVEIGADQVEAEADEIVACAVESARW